MCVIAYDGSLEGFMSAIFTVYERKLTPTRFLPRLTDENGSEILNVKTTEKNARRVLDGLRKKIGRAGLTKILTAFYADVDGKDEAVFGYLKLVFEVGVTVYTMKKDPCVLKINELNRSVSSSIERAKKFLRFYDYVGVGNFKHDITFLLMPFFVHKFNRPFTLIDKKRQIAGIYDGREYNLLALSSLPENVTDLDLAKRWKTYVIEHEITTRPLLYKYMSSTYWQYVCGFNDSFPEIIQ